MLPPLKRNKIDGNYFLICYLKVTDILEIEKLLNNEKGELTNLNFKYF